MRPGSQQAEDQYRSMAWGLGTPDLEYFNGSPDDSNVQLGLRTTGMVGGYNAISLLFATPSPTIKFSPSAYVN